MFAKTTMAAIMKLRSWRTQHIEGEEHQATIIPVSKDNEATTKFNILHRRSTRSKPH